MVKWSVHVRFVIASITSQLEKVGGKGTLGQVLDKGSTIEEELVKITKTAHFNRLRSLH